MTSRVADETRLVAVGGDLLGALRACDDRCLRLGLPSNIVDGRELIFHIAVAEQHRLSVVRHILTEDCRCLIDVGAKPSAAEDGRAVAEPMREAIVFCQLKMEAGIALSTPALPFSTNCG